MKFETYEQVEEAIMQVVNEEIVEGEFMRTLVEGQWNQAMVREFALQYSYYSRNFPRVLAAAVTAVVAEDDWWIPLVDNIWDEAGRGKPNGSHTILYHSFMVTAAPDVPTDERHIPDYPIAPPAIDAVNNFINFLRNATPLEAMAAIGFGSEYFAGKVMGLIGRGMEHPNYNQDRKIDATFWTVHADIHEPRHYALCKNVLQRYTTPQDLEAMFNAGAYIARCEARFYDGLSRRRIPVLIPFLIIYY